MTITIIQERLKTYGVRSKQEEKNALKEIYQEIALSGLARSEFFKLAAFQGGTCLRIIHQLRRFSEDLDFILIQTSQQPFKWGPYLKAIEFEFKSFGIKLEIKDRSQVKGPIKRAFLKENSFARIFELTYDQLPSDEKKITIKLEIDIHPPVGSNFESAHLSYPYPFAVLTQDLPSLFASKCHALLCRGFDKGRDWFDFLWYLSMNVEINYLFLKKALFQEGPYKDLDIPVHKEWLISELYKKIDSINWKVARSDVEAFLRPEERKFVENWNALFFQSQLKKIHAIFPKTAIFRIANGPPPNIDKQLFSSAISDLSIETVEELIASKTYWYQPLKEIESLEDFVEYECIFINFENSGERKELHARVKKNQELKHVAIPGKKATLPGWFIKEWNSRKLTYTNNTPRALFWFQPTFLIPQVIQESLSSYAQEEGINRHRTL